VTRRERTGGKRRAEPAAERPEGRVIAVTGTREFLGAGLVARCQADPSCAAVLAVDAPAVLAADKTRALEIDIARPGADVRLADAFASAGVDTVVHAAFRPVPTHQIEAMHELESIGTMNVLAACESTSVSTLVVWSQTFLYGARPDNPALLPESSPLRAPRDSAFTRDKLEAEKQVAAFAARVERCRVVVLRTAPIVGPNAVGIIPALVRHTLVPVAAGFDPLLQVVHLYDVLDAFKLAVDGNHAGPFNIVAEGVLPVTTAVLVAGRLPLPIPPGALRRLLDALWAVRASEASAPFVDYLMYPCVADGSRAAREMGFRPTYSTQEALAHHAHHAGRAGSRPPPAAEGQAR